MLNPKQAAFCKEYVIDLNGSQAAIRAGYKAKASKEQASVMLTKANIQQEVQRLQAIKSERNDISADTVIQDIKDIIADAMKIDSTGSMSSHTAALKGYELLGRHLAMWTDKKVVDSTVKVSGFTIVGVPSDADHIQRK